MERKTSNPKPAFTKTTQPTTPPGYRPEPKVPDSVKRGGDGTGYDNRSDAEKARR